MPTKTQSPELSCLTYAGMLGHRFVVVRRWECWEVAGEFSSLSRSKQHAESCDGDSRVYERTQSGWRLVGSYSNPVD